SDVCSSDLEELQKSLGDERVVIEVRGEARPAVLVRRDQAVAAPHACADEVRCPRRGVDEIRPLQPSCRAGESADREPVPPRENLLVATRPHAPLARFEELTPRAGEELRRIGLAERVDGLDDLEMPCLAAAVRILEVRLAVEAEDALRDLRL